MNDNLVAWEYFSKRRNVTLVQFLQTRKIENYEDLKRACQRLSVRAPSEGDYETAVQSLIVVPTKRKAKPVTKKPAVEKKPVRRKRAPRKKSE